MRPGFSEDGVSLTLPAGDYRLTVSPATGANLTTFSLVLDGATPNEEAKVGSLSLDMARVGLFDRRAFLRAFTGDAEELFEWSSEASERQKSQWGGFVRHKLSGLEALYVNIGSDCQCSVYALRRGPDAIGVRVVPIPPTPAPPPKERGRKIVAEVKWIGDSYPWSFVFEESVLRFEAFLEEVLGEIGASEREGECFLSDDIDPDAPIRTFRRRYKGITRIQLYVPKPYPQKRRSFLRVSAPTGVFQESPHITSRQLATIVYDLLLKAWNVA